MSRIGNYVVFWSRAFIQYMRMKSYSEFGVPLEYLNHSWSGPDAYSKFQDKKIFLKNHPEVRHLWQDWKRERAKLHQIGFDNGQVLNRRTNEQFTFNTSIKHMPWLEYKHYPEVENFDVTDALIASAEILASTGKTIDFFWSGGIDSTAALIALNEVCPKQLHVIIGHSTEYQDYYDKVVKHLDHTINTEQNVFKEASPDKHILCPCGQADEIFGSAGFGKSSLDYEDTPEKIYKTWELKREYKWSSGTLRFLLEWEGDKIDMSNHMPIYVQPPLEKWVVNEHMKGLGEASIFGEMDENNPESFRCCLYMKPVYYLKYKMPLRDHIYRFTKDKEYAYKKGKGISLVRGQVLNNRLEGEKEHEYRVWGILDDGTILTKDNIHKYDWRDFFHHYKEEWY